jgi:hypothetical protein
MQTLNDSNTSTTVTEILDKDGKLVARFTREYGPSVSAKEAMAIESLLIEAAAKLGS